MKKIYTIKKYYFCNIPAKSYLWDIKNGKVVIKQPLPEFLYSFTTESEWLRWKEKQHQPPKKWNFSKLLYQEYELTSSLIFANSKAYILSNYTKEKTIVFKIPTEVLNVWHLCLPEEKHCKWSVGYSNPISFEDMEMVSVCPIRKHKNNQNEAKQPERVHINFNKNLDHLENFLEKTEKESVEFILSLPEKISPWIHPEKNKSRSVQITTPTTAKVLQEENDERFQDKTSQTNKMEPQSIQNKNITHYLKMNMKENVDRTKKWFILNIKPHIQDIIHRLHLV